MPQGLDAIANLELSLSREHGSAAGFYELARLKLAAGDIPGAIAAYSQCLTFDRHNAAVYNNLGAVLIKAGRFDDAVGALQTALALQPAYQRALVNLGKALRESGRLLEALTRLEEALALQPGYVPALVNLGDTLCAIGDVEAALHALERAVQLAPDHVEAHMTLGIARQQAGHVAAALESLRYAVALAPEHADAHSNLAHALFYSGDWPAAWPHFEYRFQRSAQRAALRPPAQVARWDGIAAPLRELWLVGEQGLGDQLQFARYAKVLQAEGFDCVIACDPRLVKLLALALPGPRVVPFDTAPVEPAATRWIPLMSLPHWHRTRPDTVPHAAGYLAVDPLRVAHWRTRLPAARGPRVALAWAGNPRMETGRYAGRSPPLASLAPVADIPVTFISLQKGPGEEQLDAVPFGRTITRLTDLDAGPDAFLDTAAILTCVDLLITADTAIAHLAGGLGVPTWLCLMHEPDWRWMSRGSGTPWYASMRLYRQPTPGDWASVYAAVAGDLAQWVASR
ncbi:MAG: tetratricopeptide repeat protein [Steroidobacteraceae bacterium]